MTCHAKLPDGRVLERAFFRQNQRFVQRKLFLLRSFSINIKTIEVKENILARKQKFTILAGEDGCLVD